jgi:hypothetical protein
MAFDSAKAKRGVVAALAGAAAAAVAYIGSAVVGIHPGDITSNGAVAGVIGSVIGLVVMYIGKARAWFESQSK